MPSSTATAPADAKWETSTAMTNRRSSSQAAKADAVAIPDKWTEGLDASDLKEVENNVVAINTAYYNCVTETANALCKIKDCIPEGHWIAFTLSDEIPLSSRAILDLVRANEWLALSEEKRIDKALLGSMAPRALSLIAGVAIKAGYATTDEEKEEAEATLNRIEDRLRAGKRLAVEDVSKEMGKYKGQQRKQTVKKGEIVEQVKQLEAEKAELEAIHKELKEKNAEMEAELKELRRWKEALFDRRS